MHRPFRSRGPILAASLLLAAGAVGTLPAAAQSARRPGIRVRFMSLDSSGGVSGSAFIPVAPSAVKTAAGKASGCAQATRLTAEAELPRGPVRKIHLDLVLDRAALARWRGARSSERGSLAVPFKAAHPAACGAAALAVTLKDGATVRSGDRGEVTLHEATLAPGGAVAGRFSATVTHDGSPLTLSGKLHLSLPD